MSSVKEDTIKGVKWSAIEKISLQVIQFVIGIILARLLSPSDFGVVGMLTIFISISQTIIDGGFSNALIQKKNRTERDYSTAFYFNIVIGVILWGGLCLLAPYIATFFRVPELKDLLIVLSMTVFLNSLTVVQIARQTISVDFKSQAEATLIAVVISGALGIYLAFNGFGVWSLVWQQVVSAILRCIVVWCQVRWKPLLCFSKESFNSLFSYGSKILASNLLNTFYQHLNTIAIGKFYTAKDLGCYTRGQNFALVPTSVVSDILGRVTFPILSKIQDEDEKLVSIYRKYIGMTSMIIFFLMVLLAAVAKPLVLLLLSEKWFDAIIFLQLFCFAVMFDHIIKLNLNLLQVKGRSDLYLKLEIYKKILAAIILFISIPFGVLAICFSKIVYSQVALCMNTYYTGKLFNMGYLCQVRDFSGYLIKSVLSCLPAFVLVSLDLNLWVQLILGITFSSFLYYILMKKDPYLMEILHIFKHKKN